MRCAFLIPDPSRALAECLIRTADKQVIAVPDTHAACGTARRLVEEGAESLILCGAFTAQDVHTVANAVQYRVPVRHAAPLTDVQPTACGEDDTASPAADRPCPAARPDGFDPADMMGPNALRIAEELTADLVLPPDARILDLGCGKGISSLFLYRKYRAQVYAVDLWIPPTENLARFSAAGADRSVIPLHADAHALPFAHGFFDAVISVDAYHYFGTNPAYFPTRLAPLLRPGGVVALAFPGLSADLGGRIPEEMTPFWDAESLACWRTAEFWEETLSPHLKELSVWVMRCFDRAWQDWLATDNPHAVSDRAMMAADRGRYMNLLAVTGKKG